MEHETETNAGTLFPAESEQLGNTNGENTKLVWWEDEPQSANIDRVAAHLYRITNDGREKIYKFDCRADQVPDEHEIGVRFGSGKFEYIINQWIDGKRGKTKTISFRLAPEYDNYKKEAIQPQQQTQQQNTIAGAVTVDIAAQVAQGIQGAISGIVQSVAPFAPAIVELIKGHKQQDYPEYLANLNNTTTRIIENNMKSTAKMTQDFLQDVLSSAAENMRFIPSNYEIEEEEEEEMKSTIFMMVAPLLEQYMPQIMSGAGQELLSGIKSNPLFQQIKNNDRVQNELFSWVASKWGIETANTVNQLING